MKENILEPLWGATTPPDHPGWRLRRARGTSRGIAPPERPLAREAAAGGVQGGGRPPGEAPGAFLSSQK
eukprot:8304599-Alexandrium_andersonii.AAC.1